MGLFSRKPILPSTGHAGDDQVLAVVAKKSKNFDSPRHWLHFLYFSDEAAARLAVPAITKVGWGIGTLDRAAIDDGSWIIIAELDSAVVSPSSVREARRFFERIAADIPGAEYDGWEASLT